MHATATPTATVLGDRYPALVVGVGEPLVFLGGLSPESGIPESSRRRGYVAQVASLAGDREVHFVNRRRGLPPG